MIVKPQRIHPTAIIEKNVEIGEGTSIWDNVHIRPETSIGKECIVGEKSHISYNVKIGNKVKINAFVYICTGVVIEDWVMISAGTVFTNDKFPRSVDPDTGDLISSEPTEETLSTVVRRGVTIGANATVGPGIELGEFSMIGMGAVVTKSVLPYTLAVGNPARIRGYVCQCGKPLATFSQDTKFPSGLLSCNHCRKEYSLHDNHQIRHITSAPAY